MSWRVAAALDVLLDEVNAAAPNRSTVSDGSIGDTAHSSRTSDHNPNSRGVVRARDFTDDKTGGHNADDFAEFLRRSQDPRIKYVIDEGRMFSSYPTSSYPAWTWRPYSGVNAHTKHTHVSVQDAPSLYDSTKPWGWSSATTEEATVYCKQEDTGQVVAGWQVRLRFLGAYEGKIDGVYGANTVAAVSEIVGPNNDGTSIGWWAAWRIDSAVDAKRQGDPKQADIDMDLLVREVAAELTVVPK